MKAHELETRPQAALGLLRQVEEEKEEKPEAQGLISRQYDPLAQLNARTESESGIDARTVAARRSVAGRPSGLADTMLRLQRTYGNRYTQGLIARAADSGEAPEVAPEVEESIQRARGGGQALDSRAREQMEPAFGVDFGRVRVHTGTEADRLNRAVSARAFTTGQDIFFGQGEYNPSSSSGRELLAHELTHVMQQNSNQINPKLSMNQPYDKFELEADQMAQMVMQQEKVHQPESNVSKDRESLQTQSALSNLKKKKPAVQRLPIPLAGWGEVRGFDDDSEMVINPRATLWVAGREVARRSFTGGQHDSITIPLNTDGLLQIAANVHVEKDNPVLNDTNDWYVEFTWRVRVDDHGRLTISPPTPSWSGGAGGAPWSLTISPVRDDTSKSLGIALTLGSTVSTSSGHTVNLGGEVSGEPAGVGLAGSGSYSYTRGTSTGSTLTAGTGFVVHLDVPSPPPEVQIGPITTIRNYAFYFATGRASLGRNPSTGQDENIRLTSFLASLDPNREGGSNLRGFIDGYASPRGGTEENRDLAHRRAEYLLSRIRDTLPRSNFGVRIYGEDLWRVQGVPDVDNSERHRVVVLEVTCDVK